MKKVWVWHEVIRWSRHLSDAFFCEMSGCWFVGCFIPTSTMLTVAIRNYRCSYSFFEIKYDDVVFLQAKIRDRTAYDNTTMVSINRSWDTLQGTRKHLPPKGEVWKIIDSNLPGWWYRISLPRKEWSHLFWMEVKGSLVFSRVSNLRVDKLSRGAWYLNWSGSSQARGCIMWANYKDQTTGSPMLSP